MDQNDRLLSIVVRCVRSSIPARIALLAGVYLLSGRLGLALGGGFGSPTLVWPPTGIALWAILLYGKSLSPGIWLGAFLVNAWIGAPVPIAIAIATGNTLEALAGAFLLRRIKGFGHSLERLPDVLGLIIFAATFSTAIAATIGAGSLAVIGRAVGGFGSTWVSWWLGDMISDLVVAPLMLVSAGPISFHVRRCRLLEAAAVGVALSAASFCVFGGVVSSELAGLRRAYVIYPLLIWAALRFGQRGAVRGIALVAAIAIAGTVLGHGPFAEGLLSDRLMYLQVFLAVTSITSLVLGAVIGERGRSESERSELLRRAERMRTECDRERRRASFLERVSTVLLEEVDYSVGIETTAKHAVPELGDWCVVDELKEDGTIRRVTLAHWDPSKRHLADALARCLPDPGAPDGIPRVLRTGQPLLKFGIGDADLSPDAEVVPVGSRDPEVLRLLRELGLRAFMTLPLFARGKLLGALTVATADATRAYDESDVALAKHIAWRVAHALDNARLGRELQRVLRAKDEILAIVSHDLRNAIGAIAMSAGLLLGTLTEENDRKRAEVIARAVERMNRLIGDLMDTTSIEAGRLSIDRKPHDVARIVLEAVETFQPVALQKSVRLEPNVRAPSLVVPCDRDRILQVLSNLLANAIRVVPENGSVTVEACMEGAQIQFAVKDSGPGIAPEHLPRIFDRYWRAPHQRREGAGLGLFIARGIIEAHGGRIWAESRLEMGTTFYFTLPGAAAGSEAA